MLIDSVRCEVLNASYEPCSMVAGRRGLNLCLNGKASPLEYHETAHVNSGSQSHKIPTIVLLKDMVKMRPITRATAEFTQRNMFVRDKYTCQYCARHKSELKEREFLTCDHVHPKSKGGLDVWLNAVTACNRCNNKKGNTLLSELDMVLAKRPYAPTVFEIWKRSTSKYSKKV